MLSIHDGGPLLGPGIRKSTGRGTDMPVDMRLWATTGAELWKAVLRRIAKWLVLVITIVVLVSGYLTGYGWLIQERRWPQERSG